MVTGGAPVTDSGYRRSAGYRQRWHWSTDRRSGERTGSGGAVRSDIHLIIPVAKTASKTVASAVSKNFQLALDSSQYLGLSGSLIFAIL